MDNNISTKRQSNFDLLRIISTVAVIIIHVNANVAESNNIPLVGFSICGFINVITRFSVPCFVMLSGAFILSNNKNADYKNFYVKSFYKIGIPLVIFSFLMLLFSEIKALVDKTNLIEPLTSLLKGDFNNYWFMFMLAGLYFLVPMIIRIKNTISKKAYTIGSFVWLFAGMISQLTSTYTVSWSFGIIFSFLGYFLVGNVIYENIDRIRCKGLYFVFALISFALLFMYRGFVGYSKFSVDAYSSFFSPFVVIASICVFIGFSGIKLKSNLGKLSGYTYVIYLLHTKVYLVLFVISVKFIPSLVNSYVLCIVIITVLTFILSYVGAVIYDFLWSLVEKKFNLKNKWYNFAM